jgi:hypothetical protein
VHWRKLGRVYLADGFADWAQSHASVPTVLLLDAETIRVYAAFEDRERIGRVGYVDVAAADPLRVLQVSQQPVLDIGAPGAFDDNGVMPMTVVPHSDTLRLYYTGWQLGTRVRYFLFTGLALSHDAGETFVRHLDVPVLDRGPGELMVRSAACVRRAERGWQLWYVGGERWITDEGKQLPSYNIRYLESSDGIGWARSGQVVVDLDSDEEFGLGRPFVLVDENGYRMWYSRRLRRVGYRLGYAESVNGISWTRLDDHVGIDLSENGWDSEMICYPAVIETSYGTYLFYNGNNYGETGFGVAVRDA